MTPRNSNPVAAVSAKGTKLPTLSDLFVLTGAVAAALLGWKHYTLFVAIAIAMIGALTSLVNPASIANRILTRQSPLKLLSAAIVNRCYGFLVVQSFSFVLSFVAAILAVFCQLIRFTDVPLVVCIVSLLGSSIGFAFPIFALKIRHLNLGLYHFTLGR